MKRDTASQAGPESAEGGLELEQPTTQIVAHQARTNPWMDSARTVLIQNCGTCHQPNLPTTKPGAIAVFDLTEAQWHGRMTDEQLRALQDRIQGSNSIEDQDKELVAAFVRCQLDGDCGS